MCPKGLLRRLRRPELRGSQLVRETTTTDKRLDEGHSSISKEECLEERALGQALWCVAVSRKIANHWMLC